MHPHDIENTLQYRVYYITNINYAVNEIRVRGYCKLYNNNNHVCKWSQNGLIYREEELVRRDLIRSPGGRMLLQYSCCYSAGHVIAETHYKR